MSEPEHWSRKAYSPSRRTIAAELGKQQVPIIDATPLRVASTAGVGLPRRCALAMEQC